MSAAAILSVAARKAASEGKKVGAAALTLIALVVMSVTVFPGLNRVTSDQMAEAPANRGSSDPYSQTSDSDSAGTASTTSTEGADSSSSTGTGSEAAVSNATEPSGEAEVSAAKIKTEKIQAEKVLSGPALGSIMNADVKSTVFVLDQVFTAVGDNGLSATFTFNPTSDVVFTDVLVEMTLKDLVFDFRPIKPVLIQGKNSAGEQVFIFSGQAPFLFDEGGQRWTETEAKNATFKLEVILESNGLGVKEVTLALYRANP
jgi:hypothetical protein